MCGEIAEPGTRICAPCLQALDFVREPACLKCGRTIFDETQEYCFDCTERPRHYDYGLPLLNYDDRMRYSMAQIKYKNRREYIPVYARLIVLRYGGRIREMHGDALIPVPVHPDRQRKRGYNQAELLARGIGKDTGLPVRTDILYRNKNTAAQKTLTPDERLKNLTRAFSVDKSRMDLVSPILVDDIYTTGSTIEACTKALVDAGAAHVYYLSICIVTDA